MKSIKDKVEHMITLAQGLQNILTLWTRPVQHAFLACADRYPKRGLSIMSGKSLGRANFADSCSARRNCT